MMKKVFLFLSLILAGSLSNHSAWAVAENPGEGGGGGTGEEPPPDDDTPPPEGGGEAPPEGGGGDDPPIDDTPTADESTIEEKQSIEDLKKDLKKVLEKWHLKQQEKTIKK